jgi:hypothetical protein
MLLIMLLNIETGYESNDGGTMVMVQTDDVMQNGDKSEVHIKIKIKQFLHAGLPTLPQCGGFRCRPRHRLRKGEEKDGRRKVKRDENWYETEVTKCER